MIKNAFAFSLLCFMLLPSAVLAQLKVSAEIRPRFELRNGFKQPLETGKEAAFFIEQRSRLYLEYESDKIELVLTPQDVRIWGNTAQVYKEDPSLTNIQQAWAAYKISEGQKIVAGRMELDYDNARILGNLDWAQQGRSHDLIKYEFRQKDFSLHAGAAFNQDVRTPEPAKLSGTDYMGVNNYKTLQFLWLHKLAGKAAFSVLLLNNGRQYAPDTVYFSQTAGAYTVLKTPAVSFSGEFYYQAGRKGSGQRTRAMLASLSALLKTGNNWKIGLGTDYLSGDDPSTARSEAFDPLYGTHHKFYGLMDYFYAGNPHQDKGLWDIYGKAAWQAGEKNLLQLQLHQLSSATGIRDNAQGNGLKRNFGTEADLTLSCAVSKDFTIQGGYSQLFFSKSLEKVKNMSNVQSYASWAWLMLVFKPVLLDHKNEK